MLLRSSSVVYPGLYLITLGATCRYVIEADDKSLTLSDPGATCHVNFLSERLTKLSLDVSRITRVILTHLDADRIGGIALLRRQAPKVAVYGSAAMHQTLRDPAYIEKLWHEDRRLSEVLHVSQGVPEISLDEFKSALKIDRTLVEADTLKIDDDLVLRSFPAPGHTSHSVSYLLIPHEFIIADETFGYYQGKKLSSPGGDVSVTAALHSAQKVKDLELSGIGLPYVGALTGAMVRKHLDALARNTYDLFTESRRALAEGVPQEEVRAQIKEAFYSSTLRDPVMIESLERTFEAVWNQIGDTKETPALPQAPRTFGQTPE